MKRNIKISSIPTNLRIVEMLVDEISNELEMNNDLYGKILIATVEAVNNAIIHGNKSNAKKFVEVEFEKKDKEVIVTVEDEGKGFNDQSIPDPTAPENIENIHGRGVFLIKKLSDKVLFEKEGRKVIMVFNM